MKPRGFLDTNVLVYAFSDDPRTAWAEALLASGCVTGVRALNEFANVARRKLGFAWDEVEDALWSIRALCHTIVPLDLGVHEDGLRVARQLACRSSTPCWSRRRSAPAATRSGRRTCTTGSWSAGDCAC